MRGISRKTYPKVSIVMLNYNGLRYLKKTIPEALKINYPNYEFIVVDNGSSDDSIDFIKGNKKIKLIKSNKLGEKNYACNYAVNKANGEYILLLDNDALIRDKQILKKLVKRYQLRKNTGIIGLSFYDLGFSKSKGYAGYFTYYYLREKRSLDLKDLINYDNTLIGYPEGKGFFIKKSIWRELGGYDDHLKFGGDDNDLGAKSWLYGYKNYTFSQTLQIHLGLPERKDAKKYSEKFKWMLYGHLYSIVKNFSIHNAIIAIVGHSLFMLIKSLKQSLLRLNIAPLMAFFQGYYLFLKNLPVALKKRKIIQSDRKIKKDIFLRIKPVMK